jgi:hypothetical protein
MGGLSILVNDETLELESFFKVFFSSILGYIGLMLANMATSTGPAGPASALFNI